MLFEILDPVRVDGRIICSSFRLNIVPETQQLRCKIEFPESATGPRYLVDLVVFKYETPRIDGIGLSISFRGKEMVTETQFEAKIQFELLKRVCRFKGHLGPKPFSFDCGNVAEVIEKIGQLIRPTPESPVITIVPKSKTQIVGGNYHE